MQTVTLEEARSRLEQIIDQLAPDEGVLIVRDRRPVARLVGLSTDTPRPVPGRCKGMLTIRADDDEHLKDWAEYLP